MAVDYFPPQPGLAGWTMSTSVRSERPALWAEAAPRMRQAETTVYVKKKSLFSRRSLEGRGGRFQPQLSPWARRLVLAINSATSLPSPSPTSVPTGLWSDHFSTPKGRTRSWPVSSPLEAP